MRIIPYGRQSIDKIDKSLVLDTLSNDLITTGPYVKKFEIQLSKYLKCKYSYACSSGTAAIHLAMLSINLKKGDIVLMPAVNFIASFNLAKIMQLKVYLVDVDVYTGQVTPDTILQCIKRHKLKNIKALIVMYHGGYPDNPKGFYDLKKEYNFFIIEDACHALGAEYEYKRNFFKVGSCKHADVSTFSLHPLKASSISTKSCSRSTAPVRSDPLLACLWTAMSIPNANSLTCKVSYHPFTCSMAWDPFSPGGGRGWLALISPS